MADADRVPLFDGVVYPSRNNFPAVSIALFEGAGKKVKVFEDIDLPDHVDWPRFVADYRIGVVCTSGSCATCPSAYRSPIGVTSTKEGYE